MLVSLGDESSSLTSLESSSGHGAGRLMVSGLRGLISALYAWPGLPTTWLSRIAESEVN